MTENNSLTSTIPTYSRHELRELVRSQLQALLEQSDLKAAKAILVAVQPPDIAWAIEGLPQTMQVIAFRLLSKDEAIAVYEHLDSNIQQALCEEFKRPEVIGIIDQISPDDRARLFDELPATFVRRLLTQLSPDERQATALLLGYKAGTAGRIITPNYISIKESFTISETLERIRTLAPAPETIYYLYVTDTARHLTGILSLRDLVTAPLDKTVGEVMLRDIVSVQTDTTQEEAARLIQRYSFLAIPVVDSEHRLIGIITVDDIIDILEAETTKDIYALGGVQSGGDNYFQTDLFTVARKRVVWLFVLLITNTVTGTIIKFQEDILQQVVALAAFIPLLTGTGGNVGAQSSTVVIRGLNTDEIRAMGPLQVICREGMAGALLGSILGTVATAWAYTLHGNLAVAIAVGTSLFAIAILASVAGSALPFLFRSLGLDPALMSAPFITTAVDVLGVLIYFTTARMILQI